MIHRLRLLAAATLAAAITAPGPAHADDDGFIAALHDAGVPFLQGDDYWVSNGYTLCSKLRNGMSPERLERTAPFYMQGWAHQILSAAQHELCPDTLS